MSKKVKKDSNRKPMKKSKAKKKKGGECHGGWLHGDGKSEYIGTCEYEDLKDSKG